ncbi:hypothetical protein BDF21DRAFT_413660 [Thamnidium elegans]|nr:hypothetical protein BDF21DRAFT_413660 [Thamnidium elegans]
MPVWFSYPDCAQVVADAYDMPVCTYGDAAIIGYCNEAVTLLPLDVPVKPKIKVQPYHIQNVRNLHWMAVKFGHRRMEYPTVSNMYFHVDESYIKLFKRTWNIFGQFPKHNEGGTFDAEKHELVEIQSSDEEQ